jgi:site-specific recombinase XerD
MYMGDVRELSIYLKNKKLKEISSHDLQQWIGNLVSPSGKGLERKTVNRKVSAITTYFLWLQGLGVAAQNEEGLIRRAGTPLPSIISQSPSHDG